ncbi:extracellular solute-binding protein [Steroidobacter sp.]|uniref:extracellular solute-binding protein n=1 Tax=Steroidobacter sp. TaxID=1978227 RepID=UPI001A60FEF5|nr:extracellular solute-binding protein [Steroidobacter sp.]MBL8270275.1 extracellular solute-binding protein [Steroidobacter sp.]
MFRCRAAWISVALVAACVGTAPFANAADKEPLTVNWYHKAQFLQPVIDQFSKDSGIAVKVTDAYDNFDTDVILVSDYKSLTEAKKLGSFEEIRSPDLDAIVPARWRDRDGNWYGVMLRARAVIYNKAQVRPGEIKSYRDLADPKWRGKIALRSASNMYNRSLLASMIVHDGYASAASWAKAVRDNAGERAEYSGDTGNIWRVAKGEFALAFVNTYYLCYEIAKGREQANGLKLADTLGVAWLDQDGAGQHVNVTGVGVRSGTARKDDAMKLVRFLLSKQGQALLSQNVFKYPVRSDVAPSALLQSFGSFRADELNLNDLELHYDEVDGIYRSVGWRAWQEE